jgi:hypothetical protein
MQAIQHSRRENAMTTTTTARDLQQTTPVPGPAAATQRTTSSPGTSGLIAGLLMVTGIAWNAGLEARPFQPAVMGVTALMIHILPLVALMIFLVPVLRSGPARAGKGRGVSVAAVLALAFGAFSAVFSITHPPAVAGIHDVNDVLPIAILDAGALLWLVRGRRSGASKFNRTASMRLAALPS